jgi:hypothetical protein
MKTRKRALLGVVTVMALAMLVLGCSGEEADGAPDPTSTDAAGEIAPSAGPQDTATPPPLPDFSASEPPGTTGTAGGVTVAMGIGTYCWTNLCVDKIGPITRDALEIAPGDAVVVVIPDDAPPLNEMSVIAFPAVEPQELDNGETAWRPDYDNGVTLTPETAGSEVSIVADLEPGTYVLSVGMFFNPGDVQYGVVLVVR